MILNWGGFTRDLTKQDKIGLLPKSLRAIISSCSSTRPRPAAARNCQLNISPNCGQVAAGQLAKNMTSWENRGGFRALQYQTRRSPRDVQTAVGPWCPGWSCWTRGWTPRHSAAGWSWRWWPPGRRRPEDDQIRNGVLVFKTGKQREQAAPAAGWSGLYTERPCQSRWCEAPPWHWEKSVKHTKTRRPLF